MNGVSSLKALDVYMAPQSSRTFDDTSGDVAYIPASNSHYIENTGDVDLLFLEVLKQPKFTDISVAQWQALTPKEIVQDTLMRYLTTCLSRRHISSLGTGI